MNKHTPWWSTALIVFGVSCTALTPQAASARLISLQCGDSGFDIYTDAKYFVMRPIANVPALLFEHPLISDEVLQGDRTSKSGEVMVMTIDRKTAMSRITKNGVLAGASACVVRTGATPPPSDTTPDNATGNKF